MQQDSRNDIKSYYTGWTVTKKNLRLEIASAAAGKQLNIFIYSAN